VSSQHSATQSPCGAGEQCLWESRPSALAVLRLITSSPDANTLRHWRWPLWLPTPIATAHNSRNLGIGLALQRGEVRHLNMVEMTAPQLRRSKIISGTGPFGIASRSGALAADTAGDAPSTASGPRFSGRDCRSRLHARSTRARAGQSPTPYWPTSRSGAQESPRVRATCRDS